LKKGRPAPTIMFPAVGGVERLERVQRPEGVHAHLYRGKVRLRSPHDLRDTYASQLLSANAPLLYVSGQLGHSSAAATLKHYATWLPKANTRYVHLLDAMCGSDCGSGVAAAQSER
jgi:integrase